MIDKKKRPNKQAIIFSDVHLNMIDMIQEKVGFSSLAEVVRAALVDYYEKKVVTVTYKKDPRDTSPDASKQRIQNKILSRQEEKDFIEKQKKDKKINFCVNTLKGEVIDGVCHFKQYGPRLEHDSIEQYPIDVLNLEKEEKYLFTPSREVVYKYRPQVKKIFEGK